METQELFGLREVMKATGLTFHKVYDLIDKGDVPTPQRVGRTLVFRKADVEAMKAAKAKQSRKEESEPRKNEVA